MRDEHRHVQNFSKKRLQGRDRDPIGSPGQQGRSFRFFRANRASATLAGEVCCGDLGANGTRLLHFRTLTSSVSRLIARKVGR
jgi:hypothetical protein